MSIVARMWSSIIKTNSLVLGVAGMILSGLAFYATPETAISIKFILPFSFLATIFIIVAIHALVEAANEAENYLPKCIEARTFEIGNQSFPLLIFNTSSLFTPNQLVELFRNDNSYEEQLGTGYVLSIQQNRKIQVVINSKLNLQADIWNSISRNDTSVIYKICLKPATVTISSEG